MSKTKVIIAAFIAALALSAVASATASAATAGWMVGGTPLSEGSLENLATTAKVVENAKLTASGVTIECTGSTLNGVAPMITGTTKGSATSLEFTECKTVESATCTILNATISTVPISVEATLEGALAVKAVFSPTAGTTFTTIKYNGTNCALLGVKPITGNANVSAPTGQDENTIQEITANTASGLLKIGTAGAILKGKADLRLASNKPWSFL